MATLANGLKTIELGSLAWRVLCNDNFAKLTPMLTGLYSAIPLASTSSGRFYFATDTGAMYYSNGTAWSIAFARPITFTHAGTEGVTFTIAPTDGRIYRRVNVFRTSDGMDISGGVTVTLTTNLITVNLGPTDFAVKVLYEIY